MKKIEFTLTKDEAIDYYTYLLSSTTSNRLKQIFFIFSVPLILLLNYFFFKINNIIIKIIFTIISIIWIMFFGPRFWKTYTRINIGEKFLEKNKLNKFEKVKIEINDNYLIVNNHKYELNNNIKVIKTNSITIFFFPNQPIVVPNRVLNN